MTGPAASLSVCVITHKRPAGLRRLLNALHAQVANRKDREIIVFNDGSDDADYQAAIDDFQGTLKYEAHETNLGPARARNKAALVGSGDYIVFIDDDCEPPPFWLDWISARLTADPGIDVLAGTTRPLWKTRGFFERVQAFYELLPHPAETEWEVLFVTANVAIRRSLFEAHGGFARENRFPKAGEDTDLSVRLWRAGARFQVDDDCFVFHDVDRFMAHIHRFWCYGYVNVWLNELPISARVHAPLSSAARKHHFRNGRRAIASAFRSSTGFSDRLAERLLATAAVSAIRIAYYDGCAVAAAEVRRSAGASLLQT